MTPVNARKVKPLSHLREGWEVVEAEQTRRLRAMTIQQGAAEYLALQSEFEFQLQQTELYFRPSRNQAMSELQERLSKLEHAEGSRMKRLLTSLIAFQQRMERAGIPCMAIGGIVVGVWGRPRLTRDVDVKILARRDERTKVLALLSGFTSLHADPEAAFRRQGLAFYQDEAGTRFDVLLAETSFDETALGRAQMVEIEPDLRVRVCTAEDLLIYKMVSLRSQDRVDVEGIIQRQGDALDDGYIEEWLRQFEAALDDSTLIAEYRRLCGRSV